jgi:hypothetical protein
MAIRQNGMNMFGGFYNTGGGTFNPGGGVTPGGGMPPGQSYIGDASGMIGSNLFDPRMGGGQSLIPLNPSVGGGNFGPVVDAQPFNPNLNPSLPISPIPIGGGTIPSLPPINNLPPRYIPTPVPNPPITTEPPTLRPDPLPTQPKFEQNFQPKDVGGNGVTIMPWTSGMVNYDNSQNNNDRGSGRLGPFPNNGGNSGTNNPPPPPDDIDPKDPKNIPSGTRIYTKFNSNTDIIDRVKEVRTKGLWYNNSGSLETFFTGSSQTATQKQYYYEVYPELSTNCVSQPQFSVTYGHRYGSGSYSGGGQLNDSPSKAIYSQYKLLCLNQNETIFEFKNSVTSNHIYAINLNRNRLEDKLDPGNFQLSLTKLTGDSYDNLDYTGSNVSVDTGSTLFTLIDDSGDANQSVTHLGSSGRVYNLVSGSISSGAYTGDNNSWGLVYPDLGILVLNADVVDQSCSFNSVTSSNVNGDNAYKLFTAISGAAAPTANRSTTYSFDARNSETVMSTHYFVRVRNTEYNFSNNPTYVSGTLGEFSQQTFIGDPKSYITSVGLYNNRNELLAVAKVSRPIKKSFTEESLITVKLEY